MTTTYELKRYKTANTPDFTKALKLYSDNIEASYRTDTNEIIHWIDKFEARFGDSFYVLGLYMNDILIGFTQFAFFKEERFVEIDYIVLDKPFRKNNTFFEFVDKISDFLTEQNIEFDYVICEVGCYFEDDKPTESSKTLIRLLKMSHFGVIKCAYYVPRLGKNNYESQMRAILMIYSPNEMNQIKRETYMMVINALFYKYYQRWYADFFTDKENEEYKASIDELYTVIKEDIESRKVIEINGYQNLLPLNPIDFSISKTKKGLRILSFAVLFLVSIILFGISAFFIKKKLDIDFANQISILTAGVLIASLVTSYVFGTKSKLGTKLIEKLIEKL